MQKNQGYIGIPSHFMAINKNQNNKCWLGCMEYGTLNTLLVRMLINCHYGEMVQWLRVLAVLLADPGSNPSACMAILNCL